MKNKIRKLGNLKNPESFIQVNTIKGFKYIDKAGEVVNNFHKDDRPPQFTMSLHELIIQKPHDKIETLKVSSQILWMKFSIIETLDSVSSIFLQETENILSIFDVTKVNRIGWRNYFIYEFTDKSEQENSLNKLTPINGHKVSSINLALDTQHNFKANLGVQPVIKKETQNIYGLLFDVDIYQESVINFKEIRKILNNFKSYLTHDDCFLNVVNRII